MSIFGRIRANIMLTLGRIRHKSGTTLMIFNQVNKIWVDFRPSAKTGRPRAGCWRWWTPSRTSRRSGGGSGWTTRPRSSSPSSWSMSTGGRRSEKTRKGRPGNCFAEYGLLPRYGLPNTDLAMYTRRKIPYGTGLEYGYARHENEQLVYPGRIRNFFTQ